MSVYVGINRVSHCGRMDYQSKEEQKEGMQVGEYGVKKYGDMKIVCRKTRNYREV
jgi:hypothetical protein